MVKWKKIAAIATIGLMGASLSGCVTQVDLDKQAMNFEREIQIAQENSAENVQRLQDLEQEERVNRAEFLATVDSQKRIHDDNLEQIREQTAILNEEIESLKLENEELVTFQTAVAITDGETCAYDYDVDYNAGVTKVIDHYDVAKLIDDKIRFDGHYFDVEEVVEITPDFKVVVSGLGADEEMGDTPYLVTEAKQSIVYKYKFMDELEIADVSEDEPLKLTLLGKDISVVDIKHDELQLRFAESMWVKQGDEHTFTVDGIEYVVALNDVDVDGETAGISVNGVTHWIDENDDEIINGITVGLVNAYASNDREGTNDYAEIIIGNSDVFVTVKDGESMELFGEPDRESDAEWVWSIEMATGSDQFIGAEHNQKMDDLDDDFTPLKEGETLNLPNNYLLMSFKTQDTEAMTLDIDFDEFGDNDIDSVHFESSEEDGIIFGDEEVDETWFNGTHWFYEDEDGDELNSLVSPVFEFDDTDFDASFAGRILTLDTPQGEIAFNIHPDFQYFGDLEEDAEGDELQYDGDSIGTEDEDVLTAYGIVIESPEDNLDDDEIQLTIPSDEPEVEMCIR